MSTVFISHAEEDRALALEIAGGLERGGYSTWYYERDSSPGLSYLLQVNRAIEACQFVVLVISPQALGSNQVTAEVVRAHETGKPFVPVRAGLSHEEFQRRKPEWNMAVGAAGSIAVPPGGVSQILPEIIEGLELLSAEREGRGAALAQARTESAPPTTKWTRAWAAAGAIGLALLLVAVYGSVKDAPPPAAVATRAPSSRAGDLAATAEAKLTPAPGATAPPTVAARRRVTREREARCPESIAGRRTVRERGRLEARDDPNEVTYAFVICEEHDTATSAVVMRIVSSSTTGTNWSREAATRKAEDMERRAEDCEPTGSPAVRSSGQNDPRHIVYVLCQAGGKPTSIEIHATTRKADGSPYPLKVLRAAWPE
jgi:hypothetical protein